MVAEALTHLLPGEGKRDLTAEERLAVEDILNAAVAWEAGALPLHAFAEIGPLAYAGRYSAGYGRFVSVRTASPDDPRRTALLAAIDALVRLEPVVVTDHGVFEKAELATPAGYGVRVR